MSVGNAKTGRHAFTEALLEEARTNRDLFVVTSDAKNSATLQDFESELPDQFVEVGIAEQNAVGVGAGLARGGKKAFVTGPACFYSARSLEQVKTDVAYAGTDVKIIGISGGVAYGALGSTHHSLHDIAVMRTFPGLAVYLPCDNYQIDQVTRIMTREADPTYMRIGRGPVPDVYAAADRTTFTPGTASEVRSGSDGTFVAAGQMVAVAVAAADILSGQGISCRVLDMWSLKPFDRNAIERASTETNALVTLEEHSVFGGLGAIVAEITSQYRPVPMKIMGFPDVWAPSGNQEELLEYAGLTAENAANTMKSLLEAV